MAEFPPNLDDGELYLPSDFFLSERIPTQFNQRHNHHHNRHHHHHHHLSYMDELAYHFTPLSLLQQTRPTAPLKVHHHFERFKRPVGSGVVKPLLPGHFGVNGGVELGQRLHAYGTGTEPGFDVQSLKPTPTQISLNLNRLESYLQARTTRVLQRQQHRLLQQNRVLPYEGGGFGKSGGGGLLRESGGTGVFHPRIINSASDAKKKRQSARERQEIQVTQQRNSMERGGESKREDCYYHLPADMGLPRDWTY